MLVYSMYSSLDFIVFFLFRLFCLGKSVEQNALNAFQLLSS